MVAHLLRLRVAVLFGALRGDRRTVARTAIGLLLLAVATTAAASAILSLGEAPVDVARVVIVLGGAAITLGFLFGPIITGVDDPLDPRRFAVLGLEERALAGTLILAGFISTPSVVLMVIGVCTTILWSTHGVAVVAGLLGAILAVITCVLLARVSTALVALYLRERRSRELSGLFVLVLVVVVVPVAVFFASLQWHGTVPTSLSAAIAVVGYTPLGAAWALPAAIAAGSTSVVLSALVAVATPAALAALWMWLVHRLLTTTERPTTSRERAGLGWFAVAPGTPAGAIAARSLVYWLRDRRYLVNAVIIPIAAALTTVPPLVAGVPASVVALIPVPVMALFFGWLAHNDVAYDSTAIWMHIASGTRGAADRIGRLVPILLLSLPVLAVLIPLSIALHGRWALLPALTGVAVSLLLCGLGLSSVSSVLAPYPVSRPGDSPFQQPQRASSGVGMQAVVLVGAVVLSAPALWWGWRALSGDTRDGVWALWSGVGVGVAVLVIGVLVGAALFRRRGAQLMEFAEAA